MIISNNTVDSSLVSDLKTIANSPVHDLDESTQKDIKKEKSYEDAVKVDVTKINFSSGALDKIGMNEEIAAIHKEDQNNVNPLNPNAKSLTEIQEEMVEHKNDKEVQEYLSSFGEDFSNVDKSKLVSEVGSFANAQANASPQSVQRLLGS
jgi:hypothetical protein